MTSIITMLHRVITADDVIVIISILPANSTRHAQLECQRGIFIVKCRVVDPKQVYSNSRDNNYRSSHITSHNNVIVEEGNHCC